MKKNSSYALRAVLRTLFNASLCIPFIPADASTLNANTSINQNKPKLQAQKVQSVAKELPEHYFTYVAQKGDSLWKITDKYLKDPLQWKLIQTINNVADPKKLQPLQAIKIPDYSIKTELLPVAVLQQKGDVFFTDNNRFIQTNKGASTTVKLNDGSVITIFPESIVKVLKHDKTGENIITDISVEKGKIYTQVAKQNTTNRFDVRTPLAIAGVRGTAFQVRVENNNSVFTEMDEGKVELTSMPTNGTNSQGISQTNNVIGGYAAKSTDVGTVIEKRPNALNLTQLPVTQIENQVVFAIPALPANENVTHYKVELSAKQPDFNNPLVVLTLPSETMAKDGLRFGDLSNDNYFFRITGLTAQGVEGQSSIHQFSRVKIIPKKPVMIDLNPIAQKVNHEFEKERLSKIHLGVPLIEQEKNQLVVYWQKLPKQNYEVTLQKVDKIDEEKSNQFALLHYETTVPPLKLSIKNDNKIIFPAELQPGDYTLEIKGFAPLDELLKISEKKDKLTEKSEVMMLHVPNHFFNSQINITSAVIKNNKRINRLQ